jgi:hypothetical protein
MLTILKKYNRTRNSASLLLLTISVVLCIATSCISIENVTNDYTKLSEEQKKKIVPLPNFKDQNWDLIYKINGLQLRSELINHERSIVYVLKNGCTSTSCKPLMNYVDYAKQHSYSLFLVMDGYCSLTQTTDQYPKTQLYAIDNDHYKEKKKRKYRQYFINDMLGRNLEVKESMTEGRLYFLTKDKLDSVVQELPNK